MRAMLAQLCDATAESGVAADEGALDPDVAVRIEIARMVRMIGQAKSEIAQIKHPVADTNRIEDARSELDAIVQDTANATEEILAQAEAQMDLLTRLAGAIAGDSEAEALCAQVETASIKIMEACNFQDLTGQRTSKVISTLRHIEERIVAMIGIWGIEAFEELPIPEDEIEGDEALLNGPARAGEGISQADIDALFD
jgi:chemotaxis protein CheZ